MILIRGEGMTLEKTLDLILSELREVRKELKSTRIEVNEIRIQQIKMDKRLGEKIDNLTSQTSNAVIEHHGKSLSFIKEKLINLEEEVF